MKLMGKQFKNAEEFDHPLMASMYGITKIETKISEKYIEVKQRSTDESPSFTHPAVPDE